MKFGLKKGDIEVLQDVFGRFPKIKRVVILGSRAMGNFKKGSDVDLAIMGKINPDIITHVSMILNEETTLPYFFDILHYSAIASKELKHHIDEHGVLIYEKR